MLMRYYLMMRSETYMTNMENQVLKALAWAWSTLTTHLISSNRCYSKALVGWAVWGDADLLPTVQSKAMMRATTSSLTSKKQHLVSRKRLTSPDCITCNNSGAKPGTKPTKCQTCRGQGQVISSARTPLGIFQQVMTCLTCNGTGKSFTPCKTCEGDGRVIRKKTNSVKIPTGVDSGNQIWVRSEGNAGKRGSRHGDLHIFVEVRSDPALKRDGTNILYTCKVSYIDALLGTTIQVPTVDGKVDLKIPSGTQPGMTLVMLKRGVPYTGKPKMRGDQLMRVHVEIPMSLSSEERKLIEELSALKHKTKTTSGVSATVG